MKRDIDLEVLTYATCDERRGARRVGSTVGLAVAVVLVVDQLTKRWAVDRLMGQAPIDVVWTLRLVYAENTGMAFSKGSGMGNLIALVVVAIVVVLVGFVANLLFIQGHVRRGINDDVPARDDGYNHLIRRSLQGE